MKGLTIIITAITTFVIIFIVSTLGYGPCSILNPQPIIIIIIVASLLAPLPSSLLSSSPPRHHGNTLFGCYCQRLLHKMTNSRAGFTPLVFTFFERQILGQETQNFAHFASILTNKLDECTCRKEDRGCIPTFT